MLTQAELAAIRERCEKATPGPWKYVKYKDAPNVEIYADISDAADECPFIGSTSEYHANEVTGNTMQVDAVNNAYFIAHAREDIPALLEMINELHDRTGTYISMAAHLKLCSDFKRLEERCEKAEKSLIGAGYTDCGGELWKPPLGPKPDFFQIDAMRTALMELAPCPTCRHNDTETFMCAAHGVYINRGCTGCDSWEFCADRFSESESSPQ